MAYLSILEILNFYRNVFACQEVCDSLICELFKATSIIEGNPYFGEVNCLSQAMKESMISRIEKLENGRIEAPFNVRITWKKVN